MSGDFAQFPAGFLSGQGPEIDDLRVLGKRGAGSVEEPFHGTGMAGDDFEWIRPRKSRQTGVAAGRHLTKVSHAFERLSAGAKVAQHPVLHILRHHLGIGAAAIKEAGRGFGHDGHFSMTVGRAQPFTASKVPRENLVIKHL